MPSSIVGSIAGSVASAGVSKLLGGGKKGGGSGSSGGMAGGLVPFNAGGMNLRYNDSGIPILTSNPERLALVNKISNAYTDQAGFLTSQIPGIKSAYGDATSAVNSALPLVAPGFGNLTNARVGAIRDAGTASRSDLRGDLAKRRVIGSSFGNDALARNDAEFAKQEAEAKATSFLQELDATMQLIDKRLSYQTQGIDAVINYASQAYDATRAADQTQLNEMDAQLSVIKSILGNAQDVARQNAALDQQAASEKNGFINNISGGIGDIVSGYGAGRGWWGGFDPSTGITWNSGNGSFL